MFNVEIFKKEAERVGLDIVGGSVNDEAQVMYVYFKHDYVDCIKIHYTTNTNDVVNVYCGENGDAKFGYRFKSNKHMAEYLAALKDAV